MRENHGKRAAYAIAPDWAEGSAPRNPMRRAIPSLLLINLPDADLYVIATRQESDAIADPGSFMGRLLRARCALLSLHYVSNN